MLPFNEFDETHDTNDALDMQAFISFHFLQCNKRACSHTGDDPPRARSDRLWRDFWSKFFTSPVYSSVSFASYPKSFWESDLCKKAPLKAIRSKKKKSQRTNNGTFDFSTFLFFQNGFWHNSRQELNLKLTPQGFCITRHIDGVVAFGAIPIWWFSGHLTQISTQDFVVLTGEIFFGRVLGHGRVLVNQKWPVLGRYFQTKMESELYWWC